jgi:hypothetical protein
LVSNYSVKPALRSDKHQFGNLRTVRPLVARNDSRSLRGDSATANGAT